MSNAVDICADAKSSGKSPAEASSILHAQGLTIVETIKVVMQVYNLRLATAKSVVASAPEWRSIVEDSEVLYDELEGAFNPHSSPNCGTD